MRIQPVSITVDFEHLYNNNNNLIILGSLDIVGMHLSLTHIRLASFYGTSENGAEPDQTLQNAASGQGLYRLLTDYPF